MCFVRRRGSCPVHRRQKEASWKENQDHRNGKVDNLIFIKIGKEQEGKEQGLQIKGALFPFLSKARIALLFCIFAKAFLCELFKI